MELSVKQKIVIATIECIEKEGINAVTIRSIGREANVNSAAINYYFGSKEKLIEEAFDHIQKDFMMDFTEIINNDKDLRTTVEELLLYMLRGVVKYPNILRAIFYEPFINSKYDSIFITRLNTLCQELENKINRQHADVEGEKYKIPIIQLIGSSLFSAIFPCMFKDFSSIDLRNEEVLKDYVKKLADSFVNTISYNNPQ
jgi:AcrR family transcriptional regulator